MQHLLPTLKIPCKPHVAQYIKAKYLDESAVIRIPADDLILPIILSCTTDNPKLRGVSPHSGGRKGGQRWPGGEELPILLPTTYQNLFLHRDHAKKLIRYLEIHFWQQAEIFILRVMNDQKRIAFKEDAIRAFYEDHYLSESIYPVDHFRRQLTKRKITGARAELPELDIPISYKLTKQQCMQIYRLRKHRKLSLRIIASHYGISHENTRKIIENISRQSVLKADKKLTTS